MVNHLYGLGAAHGSAAAAALNHGPRQREPRAKRDAD